MILTYDYYQRITGDGTTAEPQFASAASAAQELLEDDLARTGFLELEHRSETCDVYPDGTLYPRATPITATDAGLIVQNDTVYGAQPDVNVFTGFFPGPEPWRVTLGYTGGYDATSAPGHLLRDLAWATWAILRPETAQGLVATASASSVRVGDVAVTYGTGGAGPAGSIGIRWSPATLRHRDRDA